MGAQLSVSLGIYPEDIDDDIQVRIQEVVGGHLVTLQVGDLWIQTHGDGSRNLIAFLDAAKRKVEQAHRAWLIGQTERNRATEAAQSEGAAAPSGAESKVVELMANLAESVDEARAARDRKLAADEAAERIGVAP